MTGDAPSQSLRADGEGHAGLLALARRHRVLTALLASYLLLSAVELVRTLLYDRPQSYEAGFYPKETVQLDRGPRDFWWTHGARGEMVRPAYGQVMRIPLHLARPDIPPEGVEVEILVADEVRDTVTIYDSGWHTFDYYLPALSGTALRTPLSDAATADGVGLEPLTGDAPFMIPAGSHHRMPDLARLLRGWQQPSQGSTVRVGIRVDSTFTPSAMPAPGRPGAETQRVADNRTLGVGVGELLWLPRLPPTGIGHYGWEGTDGDEFAWIAHRASLPVRLRRGGEPLSIRVLPPQSRDLSFGIVTFYWNERAVESATVASRGTWQTFDLDVRNPVSDIEGVLTIDVDRTWNPAREGTSSDNRSLGVAVRRVDSFRQ